MSFGCKLPRAIVGLMIVYVSIVPLSYGLGLFFCLISQANFLFEQHYFKMQFSSLPFSKQEFCILP